MYQVKQKPKYLHKYELCHKHTDVGSNKFIAFKSYFQKSDNE